MAYRASTYRPGTEDEPNVPASRSVRERSPRRNGRWSPGYEASAGQGSRRLERSENRSRSPDRSGPLSGPPRHTLESEKKRREYDNIERELRAKEALEYKKEISANFTERRQQDFQPMDINDREIDKSQSFLHARIGTYADELIRESWQGGSMVTKESSPRFAAEILLYVRKRFYNTVAKNEAEAFGAGYEPKRDPPNGPYTQKLLLDNMRWVYETKIKPLTDQYSKELFLCNGCENKNRLYTLESVLQHYASKHTSALSKGNVVVHWKAEWPEHPPFHPEPEKVIDLSHSVTPFTSNSSNGPLVSPRGFNGYTDSKEFEKMKRDQEIKERENLIKATKEMIERKEQEKAKKEYEVKERQARVAEAAEKKKREVKEQGAALDKPLGDSQSGGSRASSVQMNDPSKLQADTENTHQIDMTTPTESPVQSTLPQLQITDPKFRTRSSSIRSVEMGNMDSNGANLRTNQRRHLSGLFTRFMAEVSEQTALQLRRDSAKKILDQKTAAYEKARIMLKNFPSAEETTRASKERAQKEFEKCEKKLIQKRGESERLSDDISEIVYPEEEPSDSDHNLAAKIKSLEDKLAKYEADSELVKDKQRQLDQLCCTLMTDTDKRMIIESIGKEFSSVREDISAFTGKLSTFEAEIVQLKQSQGPTDLRNALEGLTVRVNGLEQQKTSEETKEQTLKEDTIGLRSTMEILTTRVDTLETAKSEVDKAVETINSTLALQSAALNDRSEMQSVHSSIKTLERSESEVRMGFSKLQSQVQALGKDLRSMKMIERGRRPSDSSARDASSLSKDLRIAIHDEIKAQQEAVDMVLDQKFGDLEGHIENLKGHLENLKGNLKPLESQLGEVGGSLNLFQNQYGAQIDRIARDFGSVKEDINSTRDDINALKQHDIHPLQIAYNNLDFRMNNLTTEHLARQILGQLDAHIRGSEKHITTLELRVQELERRAANGEGSTISKRDFEESLQKIKNELIDLNNELMKEQMKLRTELDTNHSKWQMVKADVESSKTYVSAAMGSLRLEVEAFSSKMMTIEADLGASKAGFTEATKSLRAEVDSIVSTLKTIQDDSDTAKNTFREAKAIKANSPEKRRIESPGPIKTNGHKKRRARRSISDSEDDI